MVVSPAAVAHVTDFHLDVVADARSALQFLLGGSIFSLSLFKTGCIIIFCDETVEFLIIGCGINSLHTAGDTFLASGNRLWFLASDCHVVNIDLKIQIFVLGLLLALLFVLVDA